MLIFDIETDGYLENLTTILCAVTYDTETKKFKSYNTRCIREFLSDMDRYRGVIAGHNIIGFDIPAIYKAYGWDVYANHQEVYDTLLMSKLAFPNVAAMNNEALPSNLKISYSLRAWGYRLGVLKGDYIDDVGVPTCWSQALEDYCRQDVVVTHALVEAIAPMNVPPLARWIEHEFKKITIRSQLHGVHFDERKAQELYNDLRTKYESGLKTLTDAIGTLRISKGMFTPRVNNAVRGYVKGVPIERFKEVTFNPGSSDHVAYFLTKKYGWKPTRFTEKTRKPVIDEDILKSLEYPEAKTLLELMTLQKRLGMLYDGDNALLKLSKHGLIHGSIDTLGTVSGRCAHRQPNLAQIPAVRNPYGREFRELFIPRQGWCMVGCDGSAIQLRCLAHYLGYWDAGAYANTVTSGDPHTANQNAAGLNTRDEAKTFIYSLLFGATAKGIAYNFGISVARAQCLLDNFANNTRGWVEFVQCIQVALERGYAIGIDGRKLHARDERGTRASVIQGLEAVLMKLACIIFDWQMEKQGYLWGADYEFVLFVHDEVQLECKKSLADMVGSSFATAIEAAGHYLGTKCPFTGEYKIGENWAETH